MNYEQLKEISMPEAIRSDYLKSDSKQQNFPLALLNEHLRWIYDLLRWLLWGNCNEQ
jgi:hypothetical protein